MKICGNCHKIRLNNGNGTTALGNYLFCSDNGDMVDWLQQECMSDKQWDGYEPQIGEEYINKLGLK